MMLFTGHWLLYLVNNFVLLRVDTFISYDENVLQFEAYTAFKQLLSIVRATAKYVLKSFPFFRYI